MKIQTILSHVCKQSKIVPLVIARQHREREKIKNKAKLFIVTKKKKYEFQNGRNRTSPRCPTKEPKIFKISLYVRVNTLSYLMMIMIFRIPIFYNEFYL